MPMILVMPNMRPSQDRVVHCNVDRGDDHRVQVPRRERRLEPARAHVQAEELLEGVVKAVLEEVQFEEALDEALERALGEGLEEALEEADVQEGEERAPE